MKIEQIYFIVASIIIGLLALLVMFLQACFIRNLRKEYDDLMGELRGVFGWESYDWKTKFRKYSQTAIEARDKVDELYQLPIIQKALEAKRLEELENKKLAAEKEIEKLEKRGHK